MTALYLSDIIQSASRSGYLKELECAIRVIDTKYKDNDLHDLKMYSAYVFDVGVLYSDLVNGDYKP